MPIAELHGKLPRDVRASEDTLTAGVFGVLTLLPARHLVAWLRQARRRDGTALEMGAVERVDAAFWPPLRGTDGALCEPDVLLTLTSKVGTSHGLLVEVKYRSDLSGWPTPPETDPVVRGQLGREWEALVTTPAHEFPSRPLVLENRALLYVTTHATFPQETVALLAEELNAKGENAASFLEQTYWASWFALAEVLRQTLADPALPFLDRVGLQRLVDLLRARRLSAFTGIAPPSASRVAWRYRAGLASYPIAVSCAPRILWRYQPSG